MTEDGMFTQLADDLLRFESTQAALSHLTAAAVDSFDGVDFASITLRSDDRVQTLAPTDALAVKLDALQYELHEGPCFDAATDERVMVSDDIAHDSRWPRYGPAAARMGVAAQTAHRLHHSNGQRSALNLYSTRAVPTVAEPELLELFAAQAALVLGYTRSVDGLTEALRSRMLIGQAVGLVMARYGLDTDGAFAVLVRQSQQTNTKLRVVCAEMVADADEGPRRPTSRTD